MDSKQEYFDSVAQSWDGFGAPPEAESKRELFVLRATQHQPTRILDAGCGTGILVPTIRRACPQASLIELDLSPAMLTVNREKHGCHKTDYLCDALEASALSPQSFDLILCFNAIPHFDIPKALERSSQLLKPKGRIAIGHLMSSGELNSFHSALPAPVSQDHLPSAIQLSQSLSGLGLSILDCEEHSGWYFVLAQMPDPLGRVPSI
jgi:ubiquinone/menaquinone biosynthesis C-methylase UbiE